LKVIGRREALDQGLTKYFTGKACIFGHLSERFAINGNCTACKVIHKRTDRLRQVSARAAANPNPSTRYEALKAEWQRDNPGATPAEYDAAMRRCAEQAGL